MLDPKFWQDKLQPYTKKSNGIATMQVVVTLIPYILLWVAYLHLFEFSPWLVIPFSLVTSFFVLRFFILMHDCGHGALFKSNLANQIVGFFLGVLTGLPQFAWSKNHAYHHSTNGDWVKYGGVFNIISTDEYSKLSAKQQKNYWRFRQPAILILAGFYYGLFNPRFTWIVGTITVFVKIIRSLFKFNLSATIDTAKKWESKYWKGEKEYLHMTYNNFVLLSAWVVMCNAVGVAEFFVFYVITNSLSGSMGILGFTIQHNFENSYATDTAHVNHYKGALEGTSYFIFPRAINWFTANVAYHHIHHLSPAIPNYRLAACHRKWESLFTNVKKVYPRDLLGTFKYQLWDPKQGTIVARADTAHLNA